MIFWRIVNNKLYSVKKVESLGFEEAEGIRIPDEYLDKQEFIIMRTCHGIGDWGIISAMPRLLKEKYPNCKVYVPSSTMLANLFDEYKQNWSTWSNPFLNSEIIFKNNPYVDQFIDKSNSEIFHDHYRIYNNSKLDIPLIKQMLKFWQFTEAEYSNYFPELYFTEEEQFIGNAIIKERFGNDPFGGILITNRFENKIGNFNMEYNTKMFIELLRSCEKLPFVYWTYKKPMEFPFKFNEKLDLRYVKPRLQLYIRTKATLNIGTHSGMLDCIPRYTNVFQIQRFHPLNQNKIGCETYVNENNYLKAIQKIRRLLWN